MERHNPEASMAREIDHLSAQLNRCRVRYSNLETQRNELQSEFDALKKRYDELEEQHHEATQKVKPKEKKKPRWTD